LHVLVCDTRQRLKIIARGLTATIAALTGLVITKLLMVGGHFVR
jgi:hypothetical protein